MSLKEYLGNKYSLVKSEGFDEYLAELGVGYVARKLANTVKPTVKLTEKDGVYVLETSSSFRNTVISFTPGIEFDETTMDGRKLRSTITIDNTVMTHVQKGGPKDIKIVREWSENEMVATMSIGTVTCVRTHARRSEA